ncbi:hypothetical protein [Nocardia flavorosea]|uniref:PH (Pleckstrin Homology) domain-containing protein n=1 Tax=Nocardia flavorosea TaxID=53429 RepID=A0A846YDH1_9NOCA|nr:hypothetical protein [Nocardia flavorosea]NKY55784.1 hypothetical protein [Nocardia flavorosea]
MHRVHAGVVPTGRALGYGMAGTAVVMAVTVPTVLLFGAGRVFTGLVLGALLAVVALFALFKRDVVVLAEDAIHRRTPWSVTSIEWDRVIAGRFGLDERSRWALALDLTEGEELHSELILLSIPPVSGPVSGAYDLRKREQITEIRNILRHKRIPVTVLPDIAGALEKHWQIAPPVR